MMCEEFFPMQPKNHKSVPCQRRLALNREEFVWRSSWRTNRQVGRQLHKLHPRGEAVTCCQVKTVGCWRSIQSRQIFVHLHLRNERRMGALSCNWETKRGRTVTLTHALWWLVCSRMRCWELRRLCTPAGWCCRDLGLKGWSSGCTCCRVQTASQSQSNCVFCFKKGMPWQYCLKKKKFYLFLNLGIVQSLPAIRSEEHIFQCMCGTVGGRNKAEK